jgi:hypothetical protein
MTAQVPARTGAFEAYKTTSLLFACAAAANAQLSKIANEYDMNLANCAIFLGLHQRLAGRTDVIPTKA